MIMEPKQATHYNYFDVFFIMLICDWYDQKIRIVFTGSCNFF